MAYSSIIPKKKICVSCGKPCYWFSGRMCKDCANVFSYHKRLAKVTEQEDGLPELIDRLDGLISKWVRFSAPRNADNNIECYTCGDWRLPNVMDAGHYRPRACMYLRFDTTRNIRPQCHTCNRSKYGMAAVFGKRLEDEMPGVTEIIMEESKIIHHWTRDELRQMILEFEGKNKLLDK